MKTKIQTQITVVPPPLSVLFVDNGGGQGGGRKSLASAQSPSDKERLERQVTSTDKQIDKLVYELYGLSPDEINIVEGKE